MQNIKQIQEGIYDLVTSLQNSRDFILRSLGNIECLGLDTQNKDIVEKLEQMKRDLWNIMNDLKEGRD